MVRALVAIGKALHRSWFFELVGAVLIVAGVQEAWGWDAALIVGGLALVLKAYELDMRGDR